MLDLKFIRENIDQAREAIAKRQDSAPLDEILQLDSERRQKIIKLEDLRHERKEAARTRKMDKEAAEEGRDLRIIIKGLEEEVRGMDMQLEELLLQVPNIPHPSVPVGQDESGNIAVRSWGEPKKFEFEPAPHWKLGESLDIIDFDRGVKLSGSRFYVLKGLGARLQRALISFMLDLHTSEHGYQEVYPPFMVKRECMVGSGNLPKFADN
ncbi:serine--tRNA ligase, partial [Chloroflexota bacterium]